METPRRSWRQATPWPGLGTSPEVEVHTRGGRGRGGGDGKGEGEASLGLRAYSSRRRGRARETVGVGAEIRPRGLRIRLSLRHWRARDLLLPVPRTGARDGDDGRAIRIQKATKGRFGAREGDDDGGGGRRTNRRDANATSGRVWPGEAGRGGGRNPDRIIRRNPSPFILSSALFVFHYFRHLTW